MKKDYVCLHRMNDCYEKMVLTIEQQYGFFMRRLKTDEYISQDIKEQIQRVLDHLYEIYEHLKQNKKVMAESLIKTWVNDPREWECECLRDIDRMYQKWLQNKL